MHAFHFSLFLGHGPWCLETASKMAQIDYMRVDESPLPIVKIDRRTQVKSLCVNCPRQQAAGRHHSSKSVLPLLTAARAASQRSQRRGRGRPAGAAHRPMRAQLAPAAGPAAEAGLSSHGSAPGLRTPLELGLGEFEGVDIHARERTSQRALATVLVATGAITLLFRWLEPGHCAVSRDAAGGTLLDEGQRQAWDGAHCTDGRHGHAGGCPSGFDCVGVGRSVGHSLYFVVVTATTVGYGDVTPATQAGRAVTVVLILLNCLALTSLAGVVAAWLHAKAEQRSRAASRRILESQVAGVVTQRARKLTSEITSAGVHAR
jgi:hypothetical protein